MAKCRKCSGSGSISIITGYTRTSGGFSPTEYRDEPIYSSRECSKCKGEGAIPPFSESDKKRRGQGL